MIVEHKSWKFKLAGRFNFISILDSNALIYIPHARVNCLKTIPFTAAHTYIAYIWLFPPPPPSAGLLADVEFYSRVVQSGSLANSLLQFSFGLAIVDRGDWLWARQTSKEQTKMPRSATLHNLLFCPHRSSYTMHELRNQHLFVTTALAQQSLLLSTEFSESKCK